MKRRFSVANISLKDNIYTYLAAETALTALLDTGGIGWGQMPDTAVTKKMITYTMISDVRTPESQFRNQRWRFWISFPAGGTAPKNSCLTAGNQLLTSLHNMRGTFGSTKIHFIENDSNQDPFYDSVSDSWMIIQDYKLKMRTLET